MSKKYPNQIAGQRLALIMLAKDLGNVTEACRMRNVDRTSFYKWKRRYEEGGFNALMDSKRGPVVPALKSKEEEINRIKELALKHPSYRCRQLKTMLEIDNIFISGVTIQKYLNRFELGSLKDRYLKLENMFSNTGVEPNNEQLEFLQKNNPGYFEYYKKSKFPGETLACDILYAGETWNKIKVYIYITVDTYSSYLSCHVAMGKNKLSAIEAIVESINRYSNFNIAVKSIMIGPKWSRIYKFQYTDVQESIYLESGNKIKVSVGVNGFSEKIKGEIKSELIKNKLINISNMEYNECKEIIENWFDYYSKERKLVGFRFHQKIPFEILVKFINLPN